MRAPLIAGNWKMYKTINEAVQLATEIKRSLLDFAKAEIVLCPTYTALNSVYEVIMDTNIRLGAQNIFWEKEGAYTGEISPIMVKDCGAEYVILGHSERRKYFNETDEKINKKIKAAHQVGLTPIVCVGETLEEREADKALDVIKTQLEGCFKDFVSLDMMNIVIAYEPVWAIGTGKTATPEQAQEVHKFIRSWLESTFSDEVSSKLRILYGGSIKPANINELMKKEDIDGGLIGGASLDAKSFVSIANNSVI